MEYPIYIEFLKKIDPTLYISEMAQNYKKLQNTCSIISRSYSFKEIGELCPQGGALGGLKLKNFKC